MKSSVFWDVTKCSSLKVNQRFGGTCHFDLQGWRISLALLATCFHAGFLLGSFSDSEDGGDMCLRNVGCVVILSSVYLLFILTYNLIILYYQTKKPTNSKLPYRPRYIAKGRTLKKTLSRNGLQQSMHCCAVSSRYLATFFVAFKHNYDMHVNHYIVENTTGYLCKITQTKEL
jgi:ATP/ADP translocase